MAKAKNTKTASKKEAPKKAAAKVELSEETKRAVAEADEVRAKLGGATDSSKKQIEAGQEVPIQRQSVDAQAAAKKSSGTKKAAPKKTSAKKAATKKAAPKKEASESTAKESSSLQGEKSRVDENGNKE